MNQNLKFLVLLLLVLSVSSCVSRKQVVPFQNMDSLPEQLQLPQDNIRIQPDDLLTITVFAPVQEAAIPFNLTTRAGETTNSGVNPNQKETYQVSDSGTIDFPSLGSMNVQGYTQVSLGEKIKTELETYIKDPIVQVRIENFKVTILGEVGSPRTITVDDDFISLPSALSQAGDLRITAKRDDILIIREENNTLTYNYIDIRDPSFINSPYYYLQQNDVVYVESNVSQRQRAGVLSTISTYLGLTSVLISLALIFTR